MAASTIGQSCAVEQIYDGGEITIKSQRSNKICTWGAKDGGIVCDAFMSDDNSVFTVSHGRPPDHDKACTCTCDWHDESVAGVTDGGRRGVYGHSIRRLQCKVAEAGCGLDWVCRGEPHVLKLQF